MSENYFDIANIYVPAYLAPTSKQELFAGLSNYPNFNYFWPDGPPENLQGDGIRGWIARNFQTDQKKTVDGIVITNSCDINADTPPPNDRLILFAPLIELDDLIALWRANNRDTDRIHDAISKIEAQKITQMFYIPANTGLPRSVALLDQIQAQPLHQFLNSQTHRLFRFSNTGFYTFLVKLSIHFSRLFENLDRTEI